MARKTSPLSPGSSFSLLLPLREEADLFAEPPCSAKQKLALDHTFMTQPQPLLQAL